MPIPELTLADWEFEPTVMFGLAALAIVYGVAGRRGWIRGDDDIRSWLPSPSARSLMFALGLITAFIALSSPIDRGGDRFFFWMHMVQHLLLMMVAPPLLLLGIAGAQPPLPASPGAPRRIWTALTRPWAAMLIFNAVLLVWHIPALYDSTLRVLPLHILEHLTFMAAGIVFWWPVVDPVRGPAIGAVSPLQKVAMLTLSGVPATVLGLLFSLGNRPFYNFYAQAPRLWGISALTDQQWAGAVMFGAGNIIFFLPITIVFLRMFGDPEQDETTLPLSSGNASPGNDLVPSNPQEEAD